MTKKSIGIVSMIKRDVLGLRFNNLGSVKAAYEREARIPDPPVPDDQEVIILLNQRRSNKFTI